MRDFDTDLLERLGIWVIRIAVVLAALVAYLTGKEESAVTLTFIAFWIFMLT